MTFRALVQHHGDRWLAYRDPVAMLSAARVEEVPELIETAEHRCRAQGLHAVGFVSYEAASGLDPKLTTHPPGLLPPACFALLPAPEQTACPPPPGRMPALDWQPSLDAGTYHRAVARIREYIAGGDTYQVNYSYRLTAAIGTAAEAAEDLFRHMVSGQRTGFGAFIETGRWALCSASPELFFERRGRRLTSRPMKGTAARGATPDEDAARARWLVASGKNRAENLMITDMVRNDIGRLAETGSVAASELFRIEGYPTVWQLTSTVRGDTDAGLAGIFAALFPAASITGAPKRRTMEIITELEPWPREIYTGAIGTIGPDGDAQFNVAIRTAVVDKADGRAVYGVGGGILWDSDAADEYAETRAKARILNPGPSREFELLETLLWEPGAGYFLLDRHLRRLCRAADHFRRPLDEAAIRARLDAVARELPEVAHRVRLLVDRQGRPTASAAPLADTPAPVRIALARSRECLAGNPFVRHKTTRREVYDRARRETLAAVPRAQDVLLVNEAGEVTETTIANLVAELDGTLVTPPATAGLLPGVYRQALLDAGRVVEASLTPDDVRRARRLYLANSVRRLWPVTLVE